MDSIIKDIRFGLRALMKRPAFTAIAVITLALGIGANTAIFQLLNALSLRTLPVRAPHELVEMRLTGDGRAGRHGSRGHAMRRHGPHGDDRGPTGVGETGQQHRQIRFPPARCDHDERRPTGHRLAGLRRPFDQTNPLLSRKERPELGKRVAQADDDE